VLGERGAAFDPVTAIHVANAEILVNDSVVNMAADHAVDAMPPRFFRQGLLECANIVHGVLDLMFGPLRQRPVAETQPAPDGIEVAVDEDRKVVSGVTEQRQPAGMLDHHVEHIAVHHKIAPRIGGFMDCGLNHFDAAEMSPIIVAQKLVVIAGQINDSRALARLAQEFLHDVVVMLRPEPAGA
jgi:hypothetical protein